MKRWLVLLIALEALLLAFLLYRSHSAGGLDVPREVRHAIDNAKRR